MSYPYNRLEFEQLKAQGTFNSAFSYETYLQMVDEQEERKREAEDKAAREGWELGAPQMEMTPEDEAILDRLWPAQTISSAMPKAA